MSKVAREEGTAFTSRSAVRSVTCRECEALKPNRKDDDGGRGSCLFIPLSLDCREVHVPPFLLPELPVWDIIRRGCVRARVDLDD